MDSDNVELLTKYIAAWGWHVMAILFLLSSIFALLNSDLVLIGIVLLGAFLASEFISFRRKNAMYE